MIDFLRDSIWQFLLGLLAILVAILIFYLQRNRKGLTYQVLTDTPLLSIDDEVKGDLQLLYKGKQIQDANLLILKLQNTGNLPILKSDYDNPIIVRFSKDAEILTAEVQDSKPIDLGVIIRTVLDTIVIEPLLMNSEDAFILKVVLTGYKGDFEVSARIIGIKKIISGNTFDESFLGVIVTDPTNPTSRKIGYAIVFLCLLLPIFCISIKEFYKEMMAPIIALSFVPLLSLILGFLFKRR